MNTDLTSTFKDSRRLLNEWKNRYSKEEYPNKLVLNIFYRKYSIDRMWPNVLNNSYPDWETAYENNKHEYARVAQNEIVPVLETFIKMDKKVTTVRYSDFYSYIDSASKGNIEAIKGIEYTYFLHRVLDELVILWISFVNAGIQRVEAITKLTGVVLPPKMPIESYLEVEQLFDQLGAEKYLYSLFIKEHNNQI